MFLLLWGLAFGHREPADYVDALVKQKTEELQVLVVKDSLERAVDVGLNFSKTVVAHPNLYYEIALLYNKEGRLTEALRYYSKALDMEPTLLAALYDRAEIYLVREEYDQAYNDLIQAKDVGHWVIHLRLAEVAAHRGDLDALESSLLRSLELGLDLRSLVSLGWKKWANDSRLQARLQRIILLYGGEEIWNQLIQ